MSAATRYPRSSPDKNKVPALNETARTSVNDFTQAATTALSLIVRLDPELTGIVALSLRVSLSASVIALVIGAPLGAMLAVTRFVGRHSVIVLSNALLGL